MPAYLRLEVTMQHAVLVANGDSLEQLTRERAYCVWWKCAAVAKFIHITLEVVVAELKDEHKHGLSMHDIVQLEYICVVQVLHERNLPDGR